MATNTCMDTCVPCCGGSRDSAFPCTTRTRAIAAAIYPLLCCRGDWITKEKCVCVCVCIQTGSYKGPCYLKMIAPSLSFFVSRFYLVFHPLTFSLHHFIVPIAPIMHSFLYHFLLLHCSHFSNRTSVPLSFPIFSWTLSITVCSFLSFIAVATKEFLLPCVIFCISVAKQSLHFHSHHWFF